MALIYVRATRVQSPPDAIEKGIAYFKEKVVPAVKAASGNAGAVLLVDRKTGSAVGLTLWETVRIPTKWPGRSGSNGPPSVGGRVAADARVTSSPDDHLLD